MRLKEARPPNVSTKRRRLLPACLLPILLAVAPAPASAASGFSFDAAMRSAAGARQVPLPLVMAIAYVNSRWEVIAQPSISGGFGPMDLHPFQVAEASALSGRPEAALTADPIANLDAGAALIASRHSVAGGLSSWQPAVALVEGDRVATQVFEVLRTGTSRTTSGGEALTLAPQALPPAAGRAAAAASVASSDYPGADWVPASTSNYTPSKRARDYPVDMIVIHDIEGSYGSAIQEFQNPASQVSAHYVVSDAGQLTQMVAEHDIAWHAGNWDYNTRAIGIEHEGYAYTPGWYTTAMYQISAQVAASICSRWGVPMDRQHVIGHFEVPDPDNPGQWGGSGHHTDPGPYWDWSYYMGLAAGYAGTLPSPPHMVLSPNAVGGNASATVTWKAARSCSVPVSGYTVTAQPGNVVVEVPGNATSVNLTGLTNGERYTITVTARNSAGQDSVNSNSVIPSATTMGVSGSASYNLDQPNDGATWVEIDPSLRVVANPTVDETAIASVNIDLWTTVAGFNQDAGIFMSENGGADRLVAWKESGGFAGTYSPNAAYVQAVEPVLAGHSYRFSLKLKANRAAPPGTVYAAAGTGQTGFSPTHLTVQLVPTAQVRSEVRLASYHLDAANDGSFSSWVEIDPKLEVTIPGSAATALATANIDLWTSQAGYNQDVGIFVSDSADAAAGDRQLAWKESGGFAGTFSPNAAFVQAALPLKAGHNYTFKLKWKPNHSAPAGTLYGGAGTGSTGFSPTRLTVRTLPAASLSWSSNPVSYHLDAESTGDDWVELSPNTRVTVSPAANSIAVLGGNIDLWTSQAGYNQDIALFACDSTTSGCAGLAKFSLVAWKESGGFAGTFSPNAAFIQALYGMRAGHSYVFALGWKPNTAAPGGAIFGGAGTGATEFSPTTLTVELAT